MARASRGRSKSSAVLDKREQLPEIHQVPTISSIVEAENETQSILRASMFEDSITMPPTHIGPNSNVPDVEEMRLIAQLGSLQSEQRKTILRAKIARCLSDSFSETDSSCGDTKAKNKHGEKSKRKTSRINTDSCSSSPTSSSATSSSSIDRRKKSKKKHKKRSKFSLHGYTKNGKNVKKLSYNELMYASLLWGSKRARKVGMSYDELRCYIGHLCYMCMHAISGNYTDEAFRGYDRAVRSKVKEEGVQAFKMGDHELSILHFNLDNTRSMRDSRRPSTKYSTISGSTKPSKGLCYSHNFDKAGCVRTKCGWDHKCLNCKSSDHVVGSCPTKRNI